MDEASRLVLELQTKLSELDHKVGLYRRDMAAEFTRYAENVLRDVPENVSETVSKAVAESLKGCRSLNPDGLSSPIQLFAKGTGSLADRNENGASSFFTNSTPTTPYETETQDVERPRSPHAREKEFQGVFTPSFLPLFDSSTRNERRFSSEPQSSLLLDNRSKEGGMESSPTDANTSPQSLASSPEFRRLGPPKRRNTDEWSVSSDNSDEPVRRSALRRSSSISKGTSPRRVRFDVAGEEVFPTSSPLPTQSVLAEDSSPTALDTASDEEAGSEQVEDVDDVPPKRISSSQALRALSRGPLEDDGTQWTTVSAPPDGSASIPAVSGVPQGDSEEDLSVDMTTTTVRFTASTEPIAIPEKTTPESKPSKTSYESGDNANDSETPSDPEMLDMPSSESIKAPTSAAMTLPHTASQNMTKNRSPTAAASPPSKHFFVLNDYTSEQQEVGEDFQFLEEQEIFDFDENNGTNDQRNLREDENIDTDSDSPVSPVTERAPMTMGAYSRSPAQDIPKTTVRKQSNAPSKGVVGSYKGRPFSMPIVSDEIHAQAASLGPVNSFVGSINGRSGLDESDVQSFRASGGVGSFSGTPRSMSERMAIEELMEAEEGRQDGTDGS